VKYEREAVRENLMETISEIIEVDRSEIEGKEDMNLFEGLQVDSLLALEIVATVESQYGIKIEDEQLEDLTSFNKILDLLMKYLSQKEAVSV